MKNVLYSGEWFLPLNEYKLPGRLIMNNDSHKLILELFSTVDLDGKQSTLNSKADPTFQHTLILGDCDMGTLVTLYRCTWMGTSHIGKTVSEMKYRIEFAFHGAHFLKEEHLFVKSATFIFPYLASWYDGWKSVNRISEIENIPIDKIEFGKRAKEDRINLTENLSVCLNDRFYKFKKDLDRHIEIKYQKYLEFEYKIQVNFAALINDWAYFRMFLEFCYGRIIQSKIIEVRVDKENTNDSNRQIQISQSDLSLFVSNFSFHEGEEVEKHSRHQRYFLLSRWNTEKEDLHKVARQWFSNQEFQNIYDFYLDTLNWLNNKAHLSNVMFNNRFLNVVQGLEEYFRKFINLAKADGSDYDLNRAKLLKLLSDDSELKKWANFNIKKSPNHFYLDEKLQMIIDDNKAFLDHVLPENILVKNFSKLAAKYRNDLSHGMNKQTSLGRTLIELFKLGKILLAICILKSLKVEDLYNKVLKFSDFEDYFLDIENFKEET